MRRAIATGLLCALFALPAGAAPEQQPGKANALRYDLRYDLPFLAVGIATVWLQSHYKDRLAADHCGWCDRAADGSDRLNVVDRELRGWLRWRNQKLADRLSDWTFYAAPVVAASAYAAAKQRSEWLHFSKHRFLEDALFIAEAAIWAKCVANLFKYTLDRERPFVHALPEQERPLTPNPKDNYASFYSGHTSSAFALATAAATVASLRGYKGKRFIWIGGLTLAAATAYFRVAADKHYFTDVLAGAVAGGAIGYAMPRLLHPIRREGQPPPSFTFEPMPAPGGFGLSLRWTH